MRRAGIGAMLAAALVAAGAGGLAAFDGSDASAQADASVQAGPSDPPRASADPAAGDRELRYVALGDSYTSAPGVLPTALGSPPACGRSAVNYPSVLAGSLGARLTDVSCGGATVGDFAGSQAPGIAPQFDALSVDTELVTVGIGGNDDDLFATAIGGCLAATKTAPADEQSPCRDTYGDSLAETIDADEPNIVAALRRIAELSPDARVLLIGYPSILPATAEGRQACADAGVPFRDADIRYLDGVERDLNAMLASAAATAGADFVDTYRPSRGHDMCTDPGTRWVEPFTPAAPAAPVHPNATGQAATAETVGAALGESAGQVPGAAAMSR